MASSEAYLLAAALPFFLLASPAKRRQLDSVRPPVSVTAWPPIVIAGPAVQVRVTVLVSPHPANRGVYLQWWIGDRGEQGLSFWTIDGDSAIQHVRYIRYVRYPGVLIVRATLVREQPSGRPKGFRAEAHVEVK